MPVFSSPAPSHAVNHDTFLPFCNRHTAEKEKSILVTERAMKCSANEHPRKRARPAHSILDFASRKKESTLKVNEVQIYVKMTFIKWFSSSFRCWKIVSSKWFNCSDKVEHYNLIVIMWHFIISSRNRTRLPLTQFIRSACLIDFYIANNCWQLILMSYYWSVVMML